MKVRKNIFFQIIRMLVLICVGMVVALVVTLSRIDLESLRGNVLAVLRDATNMPVEIDGGVSWKLSLQPYVELNKVRIASEKWAKNKNAFSAEKIDVRLNLISLFRNRPTIQNVKIYDARLNIEKNADGQYSLPMLSRSESDADKAAEKYPFKDAGLGGVEVNNLRANLFGNDYKFSGFNIRMFPRKDRREYSGWIKVDKDVFPFIVALSQYNAERKVYPVQVAVSMGGDALIANVALEGTSKMPIDFIVKGDVPQLKSLGKVIGVDLSKVPALSLNVAGGFDRQKLVVRKSSIATNGIDFTVSGDWDWGKKSDVINLNIASKYADLVAMFPHSYNRKYVRPNRDLNVFKDVPLFGNWLRDKTINLDVNLKHFVVYRDLDLSELKLVGRLKDNHARIDAELGIAGGNVDIGINADIDTDGRLWGQVALLGERVYVGEILNQVGQPDFLSDLPVNIELYTLVNGTNLSEIMQTITGPVYVYSVASGYAHSALVAYMYGTDFLTSLRHSIQDLFRSEKKHDQIKVYCVTLNAMLRDGVFETQNGFAIETNAINIRLAGSLNLGDEEMKLSLTTLPVRGLKLSLTGNVVNSVELSGSLAEPDIKISGAAMAGKVASATGLGLLLAPFTGGIGLVAGAGVGLLAGNLLENWLADTHPCETAMERGAPLYRDDPEWMSQSMADLVNSVLK